MDTARHPVSKRPYTEMIYQPMLEVLSYLRANGFRTFIVSGGGVEFLRAWAENTYGIPPKQVVGSRGKLKYDMKDGQPGLTDIDLVDDGPGKPVGIAQVIGRRPIAAFGNSDGDFQMLEYTTAGPGRRLALIVHHTDADREWAYDRGSHVGKLERAFEACSLHAMKLEALWLRNLSHAGRSEGHPTRSRSWDLAAITSARRGRWRPLSESSMRP